MSSSFHTRNLIRAESESSVCSSESETGKQNSFLHQTEQPNNFNHRQPTENIIRIAGSHAIQVGDIVNVQPPSASASLQFPASPINIEVKNASKLCCKIYIAIVTALVVVFSVIIISITVVVMLKDTKYLDENQGNRQMINDVIRNTTVLTVLATVVVPPATAQYGCYKGYCCSWCHSQGSGHWCYTTRGVKNDQGWVGCTSPANCNETWECANECHPPDYMK